MLFVYFPALLPLTQVRSRNISKGDRKDADTAEGDPNRINRVPGRESCLIGAITDAAIENNRLEEAERSHAASGSVFAQIASFGRAFPAYMKLIGEVIYDAAGDILTGLVNMTQKKANL